MSRKNRNAGGRKFDTRLTYKQICKILGLTPKQRVVIGRFMKEGEHFKK